MWNQEAPALQERHNQDAPSYVFGLPWWLSGKESACNVGDLGWIPGSDPWVWKIPWRRAWQPTPVFLSGESSWTEAPGRLQSMGSQRVGHDQVTKHTHGHLGSDNSFCGVCLVHGRIFSSIPGLYPLEDVFPKL